MKNRWLLNLALVLLVVVMLAVVVYRPGTPPAPPAPALTSLSTEAITHLRVLRSNQPEIVLEKSQGAWFMVAPHKARANLFRVNNLLALATAKSASHFDAPTTDLVKYGLDQPETRVWLNDQEIRFGSMHPINPQYYVLVNGQVHLIASRHYSGAALAPADFFSHQLLDDGLKPAFPTRGTVVERAPDHRRLVGLRSLRRAVERGVLHRGAHRIHPRLTCS